MKKLILLGATLISVHFASAQEKKQFEIKNFEGVVSITAASQNLKVQGYDGRDVIIEATQIGEVKIPEKAKGLKMLTPGGLDNTGLSATVSEGTVSMVARLGDDKKPVTEEVKVLEIMISNNKTLFENYVVKVPRKVNVVFKEDASNWMNQADGMLSFSGLSSELDVTCNTCRISVDDFKGNLIASTSFGKGINVEFAELSQDRVSSIRADQGDIEVILPASSKANLKLSAGQGNIYTDFDLEKSKKQTHADGWGTSINDNTATVVTGFNAFPARTATTTAKGNAEMATSKNRYRAATLEQRINTKQFDYTLNGGGVYLSISSSFGGNIYLKKK